MKKIVSLVLAISMVLSMFVSAFAVTTFEDIEGENCAGAVEALVALGVVNGLPDGTYGPDQNVTRAELAKMLVLCLDLEAQVEGMKSSTLFDDVVKEDIRWYNGFVNTAAQSKLVNGYPDGTFQPQKNVTYAEAYTMIIRATGWSEVADTEFSGVWPTAYMAKASELGLNEDVEGTDATEPAKRGDIAIMLWNMLRTNMWKVVSQNEGTGMTLAPSDTMLEIKFKNNAYYDDAILEDVEVTADGKVYATITDAADEDDSFRGEVVDVDIARLIPGMKVSSLVKTSKKADERAVLTITPENTFVEGFVTDTTAKVLEIDEVKYKLADADEIAELNAEVGQKVYVVAELEDTKVVNYKVLPTEGTEITKESQIETRFDEEALVIVDGEWTTREDLEVGAVYTEMAEFGETYYMVSTEREEGTFESYTVEKDANQSFYLEIDGEEYRGIASNFEAKEGEKNNKTVPASELRKEAKENKYIDADVELVLNYLGHIVKMNFGEVDELDGDSNFYAVMSNGAWTVPGENGVIYRVSLAGSDGERNAYDLESVDLTTDLGVNEASTLYTDIFATKGNVKFVWAEFDKEVVDVLEVIEAGKAYGDEDRFVAEAFTAEMDDEEFYLNNAAESEVTDSTIVYTVTPVLNDDETKVVDLEIKVTTGPDALEGVTSGIVVYDDTKTVKRAKYVFVEDEATSRELHFALVEDVEVERAGVEYVTLAGTTYEIDDDNTLAFVEGNVVAYTIDDEVVTCKYVLAPTDLDGSAKIVEEVDGSTIVYTDGSTLNANRESVKEKYKKYTFVVVDAAYDKDDEYKVEFLEVEELGEGIEALVGGDFSADLGDRVLEVVDDTNKIAYIITGFHEEDVITNGVWSDGETSEDDGEGEGEGEEPTVTTISGDTLNLTVEYVGVALLDKNLAMTALNTNAEYKAIVDLVTLTDDAGTATVTGTGIVVPVAAEAEATNGTGTPITYMLSVEYTVAEGIIDMTITIEA